jgi:hypothetical protein
LNPNGNEVVPGTLTANNILLSGATSQLGFTTGAGGSVTQGGTVKTENVTLNSPTGTITMNNGPIAGFATVQFTLTNSMITATDMVIVQHVSGGTGGAYICMVFPGTGSAIIHVRNFTASPIGEAIVLRFMVIKSANS